jgi:hypothetical protein
LLAISAKKKRPQP